MDIWDQCLQTFRNSQDNFYELDLPRMDTFDPCRGICHSPDNLDEEGILSKDSEDLYQHSGCSRPDSSGGMVCPDTGTGGPGLCTPRTLLGSWDGSVIWSRGISRQYPHTKYSRVGSFCGEAHHHTDIWGPGHAGLSSQEHSGGERDCPHTGTSGPAPCTAGSRGDSGG